MDPTCILLYPDLHISIDRMYTTCILLYPDVQISIDRMYTTYILLYPPICIFCNLIGTIKAPTLVIVGTQDTASNPVHNSLVVAERIPGVP